MANNPEYKKIREVPLPKVATGFRPKAGGSTGDNAIVDHIVNNYAVTRSEATKIVGKVNSFIKNNPGIGTADKAGGMLAKAESKLPKKAK